jgi:Purine catabolism regulatory protein-like family/PucR C-terminal helix-turn-helix domain
MLLRTLVAAPGLRLRVLAGADGLDRPIAGVFTTDLLDPRRYLSGGELVLTGLMWRRTEADSAVFVAALAGAGVAALAAGDAALGSVPPDLVAACREHRLPLLGVPVDVSFAAITEQVMRALLPGGDGHAVRARLLAVADAATPGWASGPPASAVTALLTAAATEYGLAGWVLSATGRLIAPGPPGPGWPAAARPPAAPGGSATAGGPAPGPGLRAALARAGLAAPDRPASVTVAGTPYTLYRVAGPSPSPLAAWFVAVAGDAAAWDGEQRTAAAELAGLAARQRARDEEGRQAARRSADMVLHQLLAWRPGTAERAEHEIAAALRRGGLATAGPFAAIVLAAPRAAGPPGVVPAGAAPPPGEATGAARVLLEDLLPGALVGVLGRAAVALLPGAADVVASLREAVTGLDDLPGLDLPFGVSIRAGAAPGSGESAGAGTSSVAALSRAVAEARQAQQLAALLGGGVRLVDSAQFGSYDLLLAMVPAQARRAFRAALLGPLEAYDRDHGTELVRTLEVFLACSGSWNKAADEMYVHVNSLRYRLRRISELTGRDPRLLADQAALLLALRM